MADAQGSVIQLYGSNVATAEPLPANLANDSKGIEVGVNTADRKMYAKNATNVVVSIGTAVGGGADQVFVLNQQVVTTDYTIPDGYNASTVGPLTYDAGISVTIPATSKVVVL
jgi:hypothetical protein